MIPHKDSSSHNAALHDQRRASPSASPPSPTNHASRPAIVHSCTPPLSAYIAFLSIRSRTSIHEVYPAEFDSQGRSDVGAFTEFESIGAVALPIGELQNHSERVERCFSISLEGNAREIHGMHVCTSVLEVPVTMPPVSAVDMRISSLSTFSSLSVSGEVLAKTTTQQCECLGDQRSCLTSVSKTTTMTHPMAVIETDAAVAEHAIPNRHVHQMGGFVAFESPISSVPNGKAPDGALAMLVVVGHRGCGKNKTIPEASMSSIRENTITSFNMAARNGAHFVEFDVQVTKDGVPVIFHDDVIITDDSLPGRHIGDVTLAEFRAMGPQRDSAKAGQALYRRAEDGSVNLWTVDVEDAMCTLAEAFNEVQPSVGFNIELKFDNDGMTSEQELHRVVDAVVKEVRQCANGRMIYFSSFHPDAVHMLRQKTMMPVYPVFFLTDAGSHVYHDERRNSIEAAIEVCRRGDLQGIVSEVKAVLQQPACVALVKAEGLFFFTYGELNNVGEAVLKQQNWGIDGVIVDHVLEIVRVARRPLHEPDSPSRNATSTRRSVSVV